MEVPKLHDSEVIVCKLSKYEGEFIAIFVTQIVCIELLKDHCVSQGRNILKFSGRSK